MLFESSSYWSRQGPESWGQDDLQYWEDGLNFGEAVDVELLHVAKHIHVQPHRPDEAEKNK